MTADSREGKGGRRAGRQKAVGSEPSSIVCVAQAGWLMTDLMMMVWKAGMAMAVCVALWWQGSLAANLLHVKRM